MKAGFIYYWLYSGKTPIDVVHAPVNTCDANIRSMAVQSHDSAPLHSPDNPGHRSRLHHSRVVPFDAYGQKLAERDGSPATAKTIREFYESM